MKTKDSFVQSFVAEDEDPKWQEQEQEVEVVEVEIDEEEIDIDENPYFKENIDKIQKKQQVYNMINDPKMPKTQ